MASVIRRDGWGIPHLHAGSVLELAHLQGRATAQDRAWQIEVERWRSEGRLAEHIGAAEIGWDRFARRARLDDTARRCFARLDPSTQTWLRAYVDGVNDTLDARLSPEFAASGTRPGRWLPWSPLGVFMVQHILFGTFPTKLWRAHVADRLGPDRAAVFGADSALGSNSWAVAGEYIAGDPHRILELPNVYQQVRLTCPEFDVAGFAFPGVPGVPHFGHAGSVAWAVTNAMADYQDVYVEQLRREGGRVYARSAGGWERVHSHIETIAVRDGEPVDVEVIETPRGPVIDENLSLRVPARVEGDLGFGALLPMLRSRKAADVAAAFQHWVEPVNSVVVADDSGELLSLVAGRVPVRDDRCRRVPVPAWEPAYAWTGYAPMPSSSREDLVNANDSRPGDTAELGVDFAAPHRARRIRELLDAGVPPERVHMDDLSPARHLPDTATARTPAGRALLDRLRAWDGRMAADSADAGAFAAWRAAMVRRLAAHPSLAPLSEPTGRDPIFAPWLDPFHRIAGELDRLVADHPDVVTDALEEVAAGPDPGTWGSRHAVTPIHLLDVTALPVTAELSGDSDCVLATSSVPGRADACWRGPVARYVWDLGGDSRGRWIAPFGASGDPGSRHFADQLPLWARGDLVPVDADTLVHEYTETIDGLGVFRLIRVDPARHAAVLHDFVTQRHTTFWGMSDWTADQVREIYEFVDSLDSHHAYVMEIEGRPAGIFQTYEPDADPVGERYDPRPGDIGMHLLFAPGRRPPYPVRGLVDAVTPALVRFLFSHPGKDRIVVEPDVRNERAKDRMRRIGFTFGPEIEMPDKTAQLAFLTYPDAIAAASGRQRSRPA